MYVALDVNGIIFNRLSAKTNLQDAIDWIDQLTGASDPESSPWSVGVVYDIAPE
jgi:hypothetical protein